MRLFHIRNDSKTAVIHAPLIHSSGLFQNLLLAQIRISVEGSARVCGENVDASEFVISHFCDLLDLRPVRNVHFLIKSGNAALVGDILYDFIRVCFVEIGNDDIDAFADKIWNSLNEDNKESLFVRYIDIATNTAESRIINKNK